MACVPDPPGSPVTLTPPPFLLARVGCAVQSDPQVTCFELRTTRALDRDAPSPPGAESYSLGIKCHSGGGSGPTDADSGAGGRVTSLNLPSRLPPNVALYTVRVEVCALRRKWTLVVAYAYEYVHRLTTGHI